MKQKAISAASAKDAESITKPACDGDCDICKTICELGEAWAQKKAHSSAPICDDCPRKDECVFICENRIDQVVKEEAEFDRLISEGNCKRQGDCESDPKISGRACDGCEIAMDIEFHHVMSDLEDSGREASASSSSPKLINQDKYVGFERSHWTPRVPMPLKGWASTISGKSSAKPATPAVEVITLERQKFQNRTIYPKNFPVPIMCSEFCGKVNQCNLVHTQFDDLCKYHHKLGKLVVPVSIKWSVRFNMKMDFELKAKTPFVKSTISVTIPEIALSHERTEDNTFAAYSSQEFLDINDDPEEGHELEYTMDTGMVSPDKSQAGTVPSFMYRTTYRDRRILVGFESRIVEKTYVDTERRWVYYSPYGRFILASKKVVRTISYTENMPVYKWIQIPTLRPIGCYLKAMKIISSTTVVTRKERKVYQDRLELQRQNRHYEKVLIRQDETDARKQVVPATC